MFNVYNKGLSTITIDGTKIKSHRSASFSKINEMDKIDRLSSLGIIIVSNNIDTKENKTKHSSKGSKKNQDSTINNIIDEPEILIDGENSIENTDMNIGDDA